LGVLVTQLHGQASREAMPFRDAATNESLTSKYKQVSNEGPTKKFREATGEDASVKNRVGNLLENSDFITFNGNTTLVPKNALIQIPERYADRINNHKQGSKVLSWADFLTLNRGWISTVEVTLAQAKGETPISPELMETLTKNQNLVVAVLQNGPISIRPPKVEAEENSETQPKTP
jgi:hypothetical protein